MGNKWAVKIRHRVHGQAESLGNLCVESFHFLALFAIGAITAWASVVAFLGMVEKGNVTVDDILLLFIYLELGAMTGIYFKTKGALLTFLGVVARCLQVLIMLGRGVHDPLLIRRIVGFDSLNF